MSKVKFELNLPGLNELMKSPAMQEHLQRCCDVVAQNAGPGHSTRVGVASFTAIGNVFADNRDTAYDDLRHNTLTEALSKSGLRMK